MSQMTEECVVPKTQWIVTFLEFSTTNAIR
jgi:hypothetical protein